jgi:RNA-directed DNA polymerase
VCAFSKEHAEQVKTRLAEWLAPRGLVFNEDKTKIVHLTEGFDFLGFNVRRYRNGKLLIKPSPAAVERLRKRLAVEMRALRGSNAAAVIAVLNPIIRGWAAYYRGVVSSKIFGEVDNYVWKLTYRWAKRTHGGKPKRWIVRRYFGRFDRFRGDNWVFRTPDMALCQESWCSGIGPGSMIAATSPTWSSSPGPTSSGTSWSRVRRLRMTRT